jgi:hypothetical protein
VYVCRVHRRGGKRILREGSSGRRERNPTKKNMKHGRDRGVDLTMQTRWRISLEAMLNFVGDSTMKQGRNINAYRGVDLSHTLAGRSP